jgi:ribosomal protein S8
MSLVNLAHVCSHLQNVSKARLGLTSIPMTRLHLALSLSLQKQGFISTVQVAGPAPPTPNRYVDPKPRLREQLQMELEEEPWLGMAYAEATRVAIEEDAHTLGGEEVQETAVLPTHANPSEDRLDNSIPLNPAHRRIWLGLKYHHNEPVLSKMGLISKPTRRIWMGVDDIAKIARGRRAGYVQGLTRPGECLFVSTDKGIYESRECVERTLGGMLLCRVL